ncbi:aminotransferase class IV [Candidatus Woesearchaeota archaeon]|nr:aminotransferase class IV [Candidatus Woesearchaeota archaeon]
MLIYLNGKLVKKEEAKISVFDHAFLYGDGVFDTLRTYNKKILKLDMHINRLFKSARIIGFNIPITKEEMKDAIKQTVEANNSAAVSEFRIRVTVSRGEGDIALVAECKPNIVVQVTELKKSASEIYERGVSVITVKLERPLPEAKTTNCMMQVVAKEKANLVNAYEALLVNNENEVTEGATTNVFIVRYADGKSNLKTKVITPNKDVLEGVTRYIVVELIKDLQKENIEVDGKNIELELRQIKKDELYSADEIFITSTTPELVPVILVDDKFIGNKKPGKVWKLLSEEFGKYRDKYD